jgi:hypothetical protein
MTATTPRGDTVILRPHTVGKTTAAYNAYDDPVLLKISTYVGRAKTGTSILGVFNCTPRPLAGLISLDQFPGAEEGEYIIRAHTSGAVTAPSSADSRDAFVHIELPTQGWEILSAYPVQMFELGRKKEAKGPKTVQVAVLGLLGKMTGAAAIVETSSYVDRESGRLRCWCSLKALGTYGKNPPSICNCLCIFDKVVGWEMLTFHPGIWISDLAERSIEDDIMSVIFGRPISMECVRVSEACADVLEIDLQRAWEESGSKAGWSNEVAVEVVIR